MGPTRVKQARERPTRFAVLNGPGVHVDHGGLESLLDAWSDDLGISFRLTVCDEERALLRAIEDCARGADAIVLNPGRLVAEPAVAGAVERASVPTAWVDLAEAERSRPWFAERPDTMSIRGRGIDGYRWALRHVLQRADWPYDIISYGPSRDEVGDLRLPRGDPGPHPVALVIHGGSWREAWERDTIEPVAIELARRGYATWNIEYRRVGPSGGGWPTTCADVAAAARKLVSLAGTYRLDLRRLVVLGHSAGGHLALWSACQRGLAPDLRACISPRLVVSLAGIPDLVECAYRGLGDGGDIAAAFMGGEPDEIPEHYAAASPAADLPLGVRQLLVQGRRDDWPDLIDLNRAYAAAASASGDNVELLEFADADHFDIIDPASSSWPAVVERLLDVAPPAR